MIELMLLLAWIGILIPMSILVIVIGLAVYIHTAKEIKIIKEE